MREYTTARTGELLTMADLRKEYEQTERGETFAEYVSNRERLGEINAVYYVTFERDGGDFPLLVNHDTESAARAYAEEKGLTYYERDNGIITEGFERCAACGRWVPSVAVDSGRVCNDCNDLDMGRVFLDDSGAVVTMWELAETFRSGETEAETFGQYVAMCMFHSGGVLEGLPRFSIAKGFARWRVLYCGAGNYDGVYCMDWRELKEVDTLEEAARYIAAVM